MSRRMVWSFVVWSAVAAGQSFADPTNQSELVKLITSNSAEPDQFGSSISVFGDSVLISSVFKRNEGAVHEFQRDAAGVWHETDEFTFNGLTSGDAFGGSLSHWGNNAVVGAYQYGLQGGAFIYTRGTGGKWQFATQLDPGEETRLFGSSAGIWNDTAVVGTPFDEYNGLLDAGSAYVFQQQTSTNWSRVTRLTPDDAAAGDSFGKSIAIEGNRILVGAPGANSVYVFENHGSGWRQTAKFSPYFPREYQFFGYDVALSGDIALVGTLGFSDEAAYLFRNDGSGNWQQFARLTSTNPDDDGFGTRVALKDNLAAISTFGRSVNLFSFDTNGSYTSIARLVPSDRDPSESFGSTVEFAGRDILVGNPADSDGGRIAGATYVFRVPEPTSLWLGLAGVTPLVALPRRGKRPLR